MKYVLALLVLSLIIIIHEFGHFIVAKASGVTVKEFSLGMGPRLLKFTRKGTMYSIKLFLFGGSCQMLGEDEDNNSEGSFNSKSVWKRIAIIAAGPIFNFILAFVLSVVIIGKMGYDPCIIYSVEEGTPAYEAGLRADDHIIKINRTKINFYGDYSLWSMENEGEVMNITYIRDGQKYTTQLVPEYIDRDVYQMGILMNPETPSLYDVNKDSPADKAGLKKDDIILAINGEKVTCTDDVSPLVNKCVGEELSIDVNRNGEILNFRLTPNKVHQTYYETGLVMANAWVKCNPAQTIGRSFQYTGYWVKAVFKSFKLLFTGKASVNDVSGPVGIISAIGDVVSESKSDGAFYVFMNLANWCIMISANLGVMNLLPIPALDGGRLVFLFIEAIRKKPVPREKEGMVHFVGIVLLMVLMVVIMFNDIRKLF